MPSALEQGSSGKQSKKAIREAYLRQSDSPADTEWSNLLTGKTALILALANKWSIAYAIGRAMVREGAKLILAYQVEQLHAAGVAFGQSKRKAAMYGKLGNS